MLRRPAVFLDRDGTVIQDVGYINNPNNVRLLPGSGECLIALQKMDFLLIIISNQSGIGRGWITEEQAVQVHQRMNELLLEQGIRIDGAYYCTHDPREGCRCRKPLPGMINEAISDYHVDAHHSYIIGDRVSDIKAGHRAGVQTILLHKTIYPIVERRSIIMAADWIGVLKFFLNKMSKHA